MNALGGMHGNVFKSISLSLQLLLVWLRMGIVEAVGSAVGDLIGAEHAVKVALQDERTASQLQLQTRIPQIQ